MKRAVWLATLMWCWMGATSVQANDHDVAEMLAKHEIEYLQRLYVRATDQIDTNVPENIEAGRAVYHRIFTQDATIRASDPSGAEFRVVGPDEWVKVVDGALSVFDSTQHLLGTQIVELDSLPDADGKGGEGKMSSFLQAWHQDDDRVIDIYLGTYYSKVRYTQGVGWQIYDMRLEKVAGEVIDKRQ